jgi:hypothetical protein
MCVCGVGTCMYITSPKGPPAIDKHAYLCDYVWKYACMNMGASVCMYVCLYIYIYIYIYISSSQELPAIDKRAYYVCVCL